MEKKETGPSQRSLKRLVSKWKKDPESFSMWAFDELMYMTALSAHLIHQSATTATDKNNLDKHMTRLGNLIEVILEKGNLDGANREKGKIVTHSGRNSSGTEDRPRDLEPKPPGRPGVVGPPSVELHDGDRPPD